MCGVADNLKCRESRTLPPKPPNYGQKINQVYKMYIQSFSTLYVSRLFVSLSNSQSATGGSIFCRAIYWVSQNYSKYLITDQYNIHQHRDNGSYNIHYPVDCLSSHAATTQIPLHPGADAEISNMYSQSPVEEAKKARQPACVVAFNAYFKRKLKEEQKIKKIKHQASSSRRRHSHIDPEDLSPSRRRYSTQSHVFER
ncbi:unnamed protein product, partial [Meganyctiphanes norvegica]